MPGLEEGSLGRPPLCLELASDECTPRGAYGRVSGRDDLSPEVQQIVSQIGNSWTVLAIQYSSLSRERKACLANSRALFSCRTTPTSEIPKRFAID
jgi:hypothetical protein